MTSAGVRLAWGWVDHLRGGGTTAWRAWRTTAAAGAEAEPRARFLPGAQQLELLRRLNLAGGTPPGLVHRVLTASAVGRGIPDLGLVAAEQRPEFGPAPVEPESLPEAELLRVATGLVAEDLAAVEPPSPAVGLPRPRRVRYRLVGDPWRADPARRELIRRGRPPGGPGAVVYVIGTDLATMLADAWTARSFAEGGPGWPEFLTGTVTTGRLPRRADVPRAARAWAGRVGSERVQVVLDPAALPRLLGLRRPLPGPPELAADAVDLARRVGEALSLFVPADRREALLREVLAPRMADADGPPVTVPPHHHDWVRQQAARIHEELRSDGYPVHGDLNTLAAVPEPRRTDVAGDQPDDSGVLALALRLLLEPDPVGAGKGAR